MKTQDFVITAYDRPFTTDSLTLYRNTDVLYADTYGLRNAYILVFDKDGNLYEGGCNLYEGEYSVQKAVLLPEGGFAVAFSNTHPLYKYYLLATEGAVIHNSTISLIYPLYARYDTESGVLTVVADISENETANTVKYLFVGNSCTYINGNPIKFKGLCKAAGLDVSVDYCTFGSAYFYEYADENHPRGQALRKMLEAKKYDYIVLQDGTPCTFGKRTEALEKLLILVEQNGAKPLLYMRYGYEPDKNKRLAANADMSKTFTAMGDLYDIPVCPVATAFSECILKYPEINLYADDEAHHSKAGSYLAACCYLYSFCKVSPVGNTYTAGLDKNTAEKLQKIALNACGGLDEKQIKETVEAVVEKKKAEKCKKSDTSNLKWGIIGAALGTAVTVAAMILVNKKVDSFKKNRKTKRNKG
ncbi:MAG: hypothetical protein II987_03315 [Clostridia bacterium]|nr:hypothetical protein [Clostridia bacterium]